MSSYFKQNPLLSVLFTPHIPIALCSGWQPGVSNLLCSCVMMKSKNPSNNKVSIHKNPRQLRVSP